MHKESSLQKNQIQAYLDRIGFVGSLKDLPLNKETLDELTFLHQCSIPFETIDMYHCAAPPDLSPEVLFEKIVTLKRGGYCFELNYLYELLLKSLGYEVRPLLCRAVNGQNGIISIDHRGILVELPEGPHFVDVGFGGPLAAGALALKDTVEQIVRGESFTLKKADEWWWHVERKSQGKKDLYGEEGPIRTQTELQFCLTSVEHIDFDSLNVFCSRPGSLFRETRIVNLRTKDGYYGIFDTMLTVRKGNDKQVTELTDEKALADALETYFGFRPHP